jgi:hypothetical protein
MGLQRSFNPSFGFAFTCSFTAGSYSSLNQPLSEYKILQIFWTDTQFHETIPDFAQFEDHTQIGDETVIRASNYCHFTDHSNNCITSKCIPSPQLLISVRLNVVQHSKYSIFLLNFSARHGLDQLGSVQFCHQSVNCILLCSNYSWLIPLMWLVGCLEFEVDIGRASFGLLSSM